MKCITCNHGCKSLLRKSGPFKIRNQRVKGCLLGKGAVLRVSSSHKLGSAELILMLSLFNFRDNN